MTRRSQERYDTVLAPAGTPVEQVEQLAAEKVRSSLLVAGELFLLQPVVLPPEKRLRDPPGMVEWTFQYIVLPAAGSDDERAAKAHWN